MTPEKRSELVAAVGHLPDAELDRLIRLALRLLNKDPKAERLIDALHAGRVTKAAFLRLV